MGVNDITIIRLILGHWAGKLSNRRKRTGQLAGTIGKTRIYFQKMVWRWTAKWVVVQNRMLRPREGWQQVVRKRNMRRNRRWWLVAAASVAILFGGLAVYRYNQDSCFSPLSQRGDLYISRKTHGPADYPLQAKQYFGYTTANGYTANEVA